MCFCGIPNKANTHFCVIIGRPGETDYADIYVCSGHDPGTEDFDDVRTLLGVADPESWEILEVTRTEMR